MENIKIIINATVTDECPRGPLKSRVAKAIYQISNPLRTDPGIINITGIQIEPKPIKEHDESQP